MTCRKKISNLCFSLQIFLSSTCMAQNCDNLDGPRKYVCQHNEWIRQRLTELLAERQGAVVQESVARAGCTVQNTTPDALYNECMDSYGEPFWCLYDQCGRSHGEQFLCLITHELVDRYGDDDPHNYEAQCEAQGYLR